MSDNFNNAIKQIADLLSKDPDSFKELVNAFTGSSSNSGSDSGLNNPVEKTPVKQTGNIPDDEQDNRALLTRLSYAIDKINRNNDPRVNLLSSIRPFLSSRRKNRLNNAIKFLKVYPIIQSLMEEQGKSDNGAGL
ncbi:MAG TPA: hypothetical protein GXX49_11360 [Clostridiaceae bacterium]|nr:hypothetical protein [Clostridiaceae bacterium]